MVGVIVLGVQSFKIWCAIDPKMLCTALLSDCYSNHNSLAQEVAKTNRNSEKSKKSQSGPGPVAFSHLPFFLCRQMQDILFVTA